MDPNPAEPPDAMPDKRDGAENLIVDGDTPVNIASGSEITCDIRQLVQHESFGLKNMTFFVELIMD